MEATQQRTVRRQETCGNCDGEGYDYHCDDYLDGQCLYGWDLPCEDCKGKGWRWVEREPADPKWARLYKVISADATPN